MSSNEFDSELDESRFDQAQGRGDPRTGFEATQRRERAARQAREDVLESNPALDDEDVDIRETDQGLAPIVSQEGREKIAIEQIVSESDDLSRADIADVEETDEGFQPILTQAAREERAIEAIASEEEDIDQGDIADVEETEEGFRPILTDEAREQRAIEQLAAESDDLSQSDIAGVEETEEGFQAQLTQNAQEERAIQSIVEDDPTLERADIADIEETEEGEFKPILTEAARQERAVETIAEENPDLTKDDIVDVEESDEGFRPILSQEAQEERAIETIAEETADLTEEDIVDVEETEEGFQPILSETAEEERVIESIAEENPDLTKDDIVGVEETEEGEFRPILSQEAEEERAVDQIVEETGDLTEEDIVDVEETEEGFQPILSETAEEERVIESIAEENPDLTEDDIVGVEETEEGEFKPILSQDVQEERAITQIAESNEDLTRDDIVDVEETDEGFRPILSQDAQEERAIETIAEESSDLTEDDIVGVEETDGGFRPILTEAARKEQAIQQLAEANEDLSREDIVGVEESDEGFRPIIEGSAETLTGGSFGDTVRVERTIERENQEDVTIESIGTPVEDDQPDGPETIFGEQAVPVRRELGDTGVEVTEIGTQASGSTRELSNEERKERIIEQLEEDPDFDAEDLTTEDIEEIEETDDGGIKPVFSDEFQQERAIEQITAESELTQEDIAELEETDEGFEAELTQEAQEEQAIEQITQESDLTQEDIAGVEETEEGFQAQLTQEAQEERAIDQIAGETSLTEEEIAGVDRTGDGVQPILTEQAQRERAIESITGQQVEVERITPGEQVSEFTDDGRIDIQEVRDASPTADGTVVDIRQTQGIDQEDLEGVEVQSPGEQIAQSGLVEDGRIDIGEAQQVDLPGADETAVVPDFTTEAQRERVIEQVTTDSDIQREDIASVEITDEGADIQLTEAAQEEQAAENIVEGTAIQSDELAGVDVQSPGEQIAQSGLVEDGRIDIGEAQQARLPDADETAVVPELTEAAREERAIEQVAGQSPEIDRSDIESVSFSDGEAEVQFSDEFREQQRLKQKEQFAERIGEQLGRQRLKQISQTAGGAIAAGQRPGAADEVGSAVDINAADVRIEETDGGVRFELTDEARRDIASQAIQQQTATNLERGTDFKIKPSTDGETNVELTSEGRQSIITARAERRGEIQGTDIVDADEQLKFNESGELVNVERRADETTEDIIDTASQAIGDTASVISDVGDPIADLGKTVLSAPGISQSTQFALSNTERAFDTGAAAFNTLQPVSAGIRQGVEDVLVEPGAKLSGSAVETLVNPAQSAGRFQNDSGLLEPQTQLGKRLQSIQNVSGKTATTFTVGLLDTDTIKQRSRTSVSATKDNVIVPTSQVIGRGSDVVQAGLVSPETAAATDSTLFNRDFETDVDVTNPQSARGRRVQAFSQAVLTGGAEATIGAPAGAVELGELTAQGTEFAIETVESEGLVAGQGKIGKAAGTVGAEVAKVGVRQAATEPVRTTGLAIGGSIGLVGTSIKAGKAIGRSIDVAKPRVKTVGGTKIELEELTQPGVASGKMQFPGAENPALFRADPARAVSIQARKQTPASIQRTFDEAGLSGVTLKKALDVEPIGPKRSRAAQGFEATPGETGLNPANISREMIKSFEESPGPFRFEQPGASVSPDVSPHFLRDIGRSREFSFEIGLPSLGSSPTITLIRTNVTESPTSSQLEFARDLTKREGETTAFTKPKGSKDFNPGEIEAVVPPGATFADVGTGPVRDVLRRAGIGADFFTEVKGQRVPIRLVGDPEELGAGSGLSVQAIGRGTKQFLGERVGSKLQLSEFREAKRGQLGGDRDTSPDAESNADIDMSRREFLGATGQAAATSFLDFDFPGLRRLLRRKKTDSPGQKSQQIEDTGLTPQEFVRRRQIGSEMSVSSNIDLTPKEVTRIQRGEATEGMVPDELDEFATERLRNVARGALLNERVDIDEAGIREAFEFAGLDSNKLFAGINVANPKITKVDEVFELKEKPTGRANRSPESKSGTDSDVERTTPKSESDVEESTPEPTQPEKSELDEDDTAQEVDIQDQSDSVEFNTETTAVEESGQSLSDEQVQTGTTSQITGTRVTRSITKGLDLSPGVNRLFPVAPATTPPQTQTPRKPRIDPQLGQFIESSQSRSLRSRSRQIERPSVVSDGFESDTASNRDGFDDTATTRPSRRIDSAGTVRIQPLSATISQSESATDSVPDTTSDIEDVDLTQQTGGPISRASPASNESVSTPDPNKPREFIIFEPNLVTRRGLSVPDESTSITETDINRAISTADGGGQSSPTSLSPGTTSQSGTSGTSSPTGSSSVSGSSSVPGSTTVEVSGSSTGGGGSVSITGEGRGGKRAPRIEFEPDTTEAGEVGVESEVSQQFGGGVATAESLLSARGPVDVEFDGSFVENIDDDPTPEIVDVRGNPEEIEEEFDI